MFIAKFGLVASMSKFSNGSTGSNPVEAIQIPWCPEPLVSI